MNDDLIFSTHPEFTIATTTFVNVPTIIMFDDTPLIEVIKVPQAGFTSRFSIYNNDGAKLAVVVGSRLMLTPDGDKAGLTVRKPDRKTICELGKKTLFELHRTEAAALKSHAELYTPTGQFFKTSETGLDIFKENVGAEALRVGGATLKNVRIQGFKIGIILKSDGRVGIGANKIFS